MIDLSTGLELTLLVTVILLTCVVALALTARQIGGWRRLREQLTAPSLPMRYVVLILPATVAATVVIDPLDTLAGTAWIWGVVSLLSYYAGSLWWRRHADRSTGPTADPEEADALHRRSQRWLAGTAIVSAFVLAAIGVMVLAEGNASGGWTALGVSASIAALLGLGAWFGRRC